MNYHDYLIVGAGPAGLKMGYVPAARLLREGTLPTSVLVALAWPLVGYEVMVAILGAWIGLNVKSTGQNL